jgi:predicted acylesterase/phospholipase RssA
VRVDAYSGEIQILTEKSHPKTTVVDAVVDSMRIPPFIQPHSVNGRKLIDGGVLLNFPFEEIFHSEESTLGFRLVSCKTNEISDPIEWIRNLFRLMQNEIERMRFESYDPFYRCMNILSLEINSNDSVNFSMEREQIDAMVERGSLEMKKFLRWRLRFIDQLNRFKDSESLCGSQEQHENEHDEDDLLDIILVQ